MGGPPGCVANLLGGRSPSADLSGRNYSLIVLFPARARTRQTKEADK
jgi:hypothetical protein